MSKEEQTIDAEDMKGIIDSKFNYPYAFTLVKSDYDLHLYIVEREYGGYDGDHITTKFFDLAKQIPKLEAEAKKLKLKKDKLNSDIRELKKAKRETAKSEVKKEIDRLMQGELGKRIAEQISKN